MQCGSELPACAAAAAAAEAAAASAVNAAEGAERHLLPLLPEAPTAAAPVPWRALPPQGGLPVGEPSAAAAAAESAMEA